MKATELRIGNYILDNVTQLQCIVDYINLDEYQIKTYYRPIPLTEEWLIKFGFEKLDHSKEYGKGFVSAHGWSAKYSIDGLRMLQPNEKSNWAENQNSFKIIGLNDVNLWIKHVHSLQNLYFALTNEELTIK